MPINWREAAKRGPKTHLRATGFYLEKKPDEVVQMTNFTARIVEEIVHDAGDGTVGDAESYVVEGKVGPKKKKFQVTRAEFDKMDWVSSKLGARAVINNTKGASAAKVRLAIREHSRRIKKVTAYTHIGWQRVGREWAYLHAGGALGVGGLIRDVRVELPEELKLYRLPKTHASRPREAVLTSLAMTHLASDRLMLPLFSLIWRAPLGATDVACHVSGKSGTFKTQLAALMQAHFGPEFNEDTLPASFMSTALSLPETAHLAKDAILVVDDYVPSSEGSTGAEMRQAAERLFRSIGNQVGRARVRGGGSLESGAAPRGLVVTTGEDVPNGYSLRGRLLFIRVTEGAVSAAALTASQEAAREGYFAAAMSHYVRWLAPRYQQIMSSLPSRVEALRPELRQFRAHPRTPNNLANVIIGLDVWSDFAVDIGAVTRTEVEGLRGRLRAALPELADMQASIVQAADPPTRFLPLLGAAIRAGNAHVASLIGGAPPQAERLGWATTSFGVLVPQGTLIGWTEGDNLYVDFGAAYEVATKAAEGSGEPLGITEIKLRKRLNEQGQLRTIDQSRETLTIRKMVGGSRREVLHVGIAPLLPQP